MTKKQVWAQKRNWTKHRLLGIRSHLYAWDLEETLTSQEKLELPILRAAIDRLVFDWEERNDESRREFLLRGRR